MKERTIATTKPVRGLIVGKLYPPHAGHHYLIREGQKHCDQLTVFVCHRPEHKIPADLRADWIRREHPGVTVKVVNDRIDDNDSPAWAKLAVDELGYKPDVVITSESYGEGWAKAIGCRHHLVDMARSTFDVSATRVRLDPFKTWNYLSPGVRGYFTLRVCVPGDATLAAALTDHYRTIQVEAVEGEPTAENARRQAEAEDAAAEIADKVLICDTDAFEIAMKFRVLMGYRSPEIEDIANRRPKMALYIVPDAFPTETLALWGKDYLLVRGTHEERMAQATAVIERLIKTGTGIAGKEIR